MPPRPFLNDGLWHCLCPGFPPNPATKAIAGRRGRLPQRNPSHQHATTNPGGRQLRAYASNSFFSQPGSTSTGFRPFGEQAHALPSLNPRGPSLAQLPTHVLYEHVRAEGAKGRWGEVMNICRVLIKDRGEQPNREMYTAILHSFVSSKYGTAGKVRKVLDEMGFWNGTDAFSFGKPRIELDTRACECVLEALAVHPDYLLRAEILEYMRSRWLPLSDRGRSHVIAGLLRERHFEQALEMLEDMVKNNARAEDWLFDKAMWMLLEFGEVEEAFYVLNLKETMQGRSSGTGTAKLSDALWGALLEAAAQKQLHQETAKVWMAQVQPGYLKPGDGACMSVLTLASRYGDVELATDVFRVLTARETTFTTHHYELLIATYLKADDVSAALSVILIMVDAKLKVDAGTCQFLFNYLSTPTQDGSNRPLEAFGHLQDFETAGRKVPTAAVNACIQASLALGRLEEAVEIYKALHTVSHAGPNTNTFNILFKGCHQFSRKELAMFFANEMIELGRKPDRVTYDRLILVCLFSGDLEDALLYYEEMSGANPPMKPRRRTWELLIDQCVRRGDDRAVPLLKAYKQGVEEPRVAVEKAVVKRFESDILPIPSDIGAARADNALSDGVEHQDVRPAKDKKGTPDAGADTELSDATSGLGPLSKKSSANTGAGMEKSADLEDGLAHLIRASKSTKPH